MIKLRFEINAKSKKELERFKQNILEDLPQRLPGRLAERGAILAEREMKKVVPIGVLGDLYNSISKSIFRTKQGTILANSRVFIPTAQEEVALANEYGVPQKTYDLREPANKELLLWVQHSPRLREDIRDKMLKAKSVTVGNPNTTWLGTRNTFMNETYLATLEELDDEIGIEIAKFIAKKSKYPTTVSKGYK